MREFDSEALDQTIKAQKKTNKDIAIALDSTEAIVCRWRRGKVVPTLTNFLKLCDELRINPGNLLREVKE